MISFYIGGVQVVRNVASGKAHPCRLMTTTNETQRNRQPATEKARTFPGINMI
jgi:hypothetical protein